ADRTRGREPARVATSRDPGGERPRQRPFGRAGHERARLRRRDRGDPAARTVDAHERDRGAVARQGPRPRLPDAVGARVHAREPDGAGRAEPARVRPRRVGWLARDRRSRRARRVGLRHEQDVARHDRRLARRRSGRRALRRALRTPMELNPFAWEFHEDPYPTYRWLRDHAPLYRNDAMNFWALSRFRDVIGAF